MNKVFYLYIQELDEVILYRTDNKGQWEALDIEGNWIQLSRPLTQKRIEKLKSY
jgi:hypothetical protein